MNNDPNSNSQNPGTTPPKQPTPQQPPQPGEPVPPPDQPDVAPPSEPERQPPQYARPAETLAPHDGARDANPGRFVGVRSTNPAIEIGARYPAWLLMGDYRRNF